LQIPSTKHQIPNKSKKNKSEIQNCFENLIFGNLNLFGIWCLVLGAWCLAHSAWCKEINYSVKK
jgi:hypothetical protein